MVFLHHEAMSAALFHLRWRLWRGLKAPLASVLFKRHESLVASCRRGVSRNPGSHFRRGRCLADIDRIIKRPLPEGKGLQSFSAAAISASTSGFANVDGDSTRMKRFFVPEPCNNLWGSGKRVPQYGNAIPTPLAPAASEMIVSEGRPVGEYPITKK